MPTFTLTATLPCSADVAWSLLTDPARMNTWSSAHVALTEPGAGDDAAGVGALRRVTLPHGRISFLEVVEGSTPPLLLRYRVFRAGPLLRHHRGEQQVTALRGGGCRIDWTVDVDLVVPLLGRAMVTYLRREVRSSLVAMSAIARQQPLPPEPTAREPAAREALVPDRPTPERVDALAAAARRSLAEQRTVADELAAADDPKQWFARVYQYVTEEMIAHALDPESVLHLDNPDWVLALIPVFHEYFITNLDDYRHGRPAEPAWQRAWSTCERVDPENPALPIMKGLLAGVSAHIEADLPRAIARVQAAEFPDRDLREFRPDYLALAPIFHTASARLLDDLPGSYQPWWVAPVRRLHPNFLDAAIARTGYDVARHRLRAFGEAVHLWNGSTAVRPTASPRRSRPRSGR